MRPSADLRLFATKPQISTYGFTYGWAKSIVRRGPCSLRRATCRPRCSAQRTWSSPTLNA
eukprot:4200605-Prymnesium_polylepis.1